MTDPISLFLICLRASLLSLGGSTALPALREDLGGIVSDRQIVESLAIGRLSTGPSGLYVVSLGYFALGFPGAAVALLAAMIPPLLLVPAAAAVRRQLLSPWFAGVVRGLALTTSGLVIVTTTSILFQGQGASTWWQLALLILGIAIAVEGKRHPVLAIAAGALAGILLARP